MPARESRHSTPIWHKSRASADQGTCVEIACDGPRVLVRDSRNQAGLVLAFPPAQWSAFVLRIRNGKVPITE
jgi:hypothetical protein